MIGLHLRFVSTHRQVLQPTAGHKELQESPPQIPWHVPPSIPLPQLSEILWNLERGQFWIEFQKWEVWTKLEKLQPWNSFFNVHLFYLCVGANVTDVILCFRLHVFLRQTLYMFSRTESQYCQGHHDARWDTRETSWQWKRTENSAAGSQCTSQLPAFYSENSHVMGCFVAWSLSIYVASINHQQVDGVCIYIYLFIYLYLFIYILDAYIYTSIHYITSWSSHHDHHITSHHIISYYITYIHSIPLPCLALHRIALQFITVYYSALQCIALHYIALHCITRHYITLPCSTLHYTTLHYNSLHYNTLPWIAMTSQDTTVHGYTSQYITIQHTTIHDNTWQYITIHYNTLHIHYHTLPHVAIYCNTMQYVTIPYNRFGRTTTLTILSTIYIMIHYIR